MESNQRSSQKKASPLQANTPARFSGRPLPAFDFGYIKSFPVNNLNFSADSAEELRAKSGKTMVALSAEKGIANFLHQRSATKEGRQAKKIAARGFV